MHFIAVQTQNNETRNVVYINPDHITLLEPKHEGGCKLILTNGRSVESIESSDDLIVKIRGFMKPAPSQNPDAPHERLFIAE